MDGLDPKVNVWYVYTQTQGLNAWKWAKPHYREINLTFVKLKILILHSFICWSVCILEFVCVLMVEHIFLLGNQHLNEAIKGHEFNLAWVGAFPGVKVRNNLLFIIFVKKDSDFVYQSSFNSLCLAQIFLKYMHGQSAEWSYQR